MSEQPEPTAVDSQRWLCVVLDASESMKDREDLQPNRLIFCLRLVLRFINAFFERNPLSQLQLILTANGMAFPISALSGSVRSHADALKGLLRQSTSSASAPGETELAKNLLKGVVSLQNALLLAHRTLQGASSALQTKPGAMLAGCKEIVVIMSSLASQDPANIFTTVEKLRRAHVFVHVFHMCADMYICRYLAERTQGRYCIALNGAHLSDSLLNLASNPPSDPTRVITATSVGLSQLKVGFCSPETTKSHSMTIQRCPKCFSPVEHGGIENDPAASILIALGSPSSLPTNCSVCGLLLVKPAQLVRSILHAKSFLDLLPAGQSRHSNCTGCAASLQFSQRHENLFTPVSAPHSEDESAIGAKRCASCDAAYCSICVAQLEGSLFFCSECFGNTPKIDIS